MKNDFAPTVGHRFYLRGEWGGVLDCEVLAIEPPRTLTYTWNHAHSDPAFSLYSVVTFTLTPTPTGTHLRMEQKGFRPISARPLAGPCRAGRSFSAILSKLLRSSTSARPHLLHGASPSDGKSGDAVTFVRKTGPVGVRSVVKIVPNRLIAPPNAFFQNKPPCRKDRQRYALYLTVFSSVDVHFRKDRQKDRQAIRLSKGQNTRRLTNSFFISINYDIGEWGLPM